MSVGEAQVVRDRLEILSTLRRIAAGREPVAVQWNEGSGMALSALLSINPDFEEMVFDSLADAEANRALLEAASGINIVSTVDGVRVELNAARAEPTVHDGRPALRMRLPGRMLRLQRREHYRVHPALTCEFARDVGGRVRVFELRVADLSLGGVGLAVGDKNGIEVQVGERLDNCRIDLGADGALVVGLEVRNVSAERIGCAFGRLGRGVELTLARYIVKVERGAAAAR